MNKVLFFPEETNEFGEQYMVIGVSLSFAFLKVNFNFVNIVICSYFSFPPLKQPMIVEFGKMFVFEVLST